MYEQSAKLNMYYREIDPGKRKQLLDELCMTEEDDGANEYRRHLYELRHVDRKDPAHEVDFSSGIVSTCPLFIRARPFLSVAR